MAYIYDIADTWSGGGAFTGIKLNVTDGGSTAGSLLMDLQVGGASRFSVAKAGTIQVPGVSEQSLLATGAAGGNAAIRWRTGNRLVFSSGDNVSYIAIEAAAIWLAGLNRLISISSGVVRFTNYTDTGYAQVQADSFSLQTDTILARDAANTLAQRNSTAAQAFNLYNTYTDASNYERGFMRFVSNVLEIGAEKLGTGTARKVKIKTSGSGTGDGFMVEALDAQAGALELGGSLGFGRIAGNAFFVSVQQQFRVRVDAAAGQHHIRFMNSNETVNYGGFAGIAAGVVQLTDGTGTGATNGAAFETFEMTAPAAPATDGVRIYAEDNGSGKTRLMALFATGVAQQIAIEP